MLSLYGSSTLTSTIGLNGNVTADHYTQTLPEGDMIDPRSVCDEWTAYRGLPQASFNVGYQRGSVVAIEIQAYDAYRYQRELSLTLGWAPGQSHDEPRQWRYSAYKHPFRPSASGTVTHGVADRFIARLISLVEQYPSLLFNWHDHRPTSEGFVHFHERLIHGADLSVTQLP